MRLLILWLAIFAACATGQELPPDPPEGLETAWFHDDCAPWDGPAVSIYLGGAAADDVFAPPAPYLRVALYSSLGDFASGERVTIGIPSNRGYADYCFDAGECTPATSVTLELRSIQPDRIEGRLDVAFESRPAIRGAFRAVRLPFQALCG